MTSKPKTKRPDTSDESMLRTISAPAIQVTPEEALHDADTTTAADYDEWFFKAFCERKDEVIRPGYGGVQHPTSTLFEIGVDSIRAGKPSELFLTLLEEIGKLAEERDVMAALFPDTFKGRIKTTTLAIELEGAEIVEQNDMFGSFTLIVGYRDPAYSADRKTREPFVCIKNNTFGQPHLFMTAG